MSRRIAVSVAAGAALLVGAGAYALAYAGDQPPALTHSTAHYTAPTGDSAGSLTFTTDVTASSGVKSVKVLAWPKHSSLAHKKLTAKDMTAAETATCKPAAKHTLHCAYTTTVTPTDAAKSPRGAWHIAVLAEAKNGTTTLDDKAADFTVR
ncbi:DUF5707 domain-containing protein [Streptomyces sp. NPDC005574]|uniref:DUF5707 domain-containing protein n=1 Tax=Streptomyces sp. NPDC005574 TaxID=3156891 RepID=UPI0033AE195E